MIKSCQSENDFQQLLSTSCERPVLLLKHSTRCPISAGAHSRFQHFAEGHSEVDCWQVLVIEHRQLSNAIAGETGITHQSPQVILFKDGNACWHASHGSITESSLREALGYL